jgi:hypothetical protein
MGNVGENTLYEIWNSEKYRRFREAHAKGTLGKEHYCRAQCDMPILGNVAEQRRTAVQAEGLSKEEREQAILNFKKETEKALLAGKSKDAQSYEKASN